MTRKSCSLALSFCWLVLFVAQVQAQFPWQAIRVAPQDNKQPEWLPLNDREQEWCDNVLRYWDERRAKTRALEGKIEMWEYDPAVTPTHFAELKKQEKPNELPFTSYSAGVFAFGNPNQGLLEFQQSQVIDTFAADGQPKYRDEPKNRNGKWITNGERLWVFEAQDWRVRELILPREGEAAFNYLPIPILFGVNSKTLKDKYWVRPLRAEAGEYCLEFVPKKFNGWYDFQAVRVFIDEKQYLPCRIVMYHSDWSPTYPHRTNFAFDDRHENNPWFNAARFSDVKIPPGWRHSVHDLR
ncbi:hypothetical protein [Anatilimnocola floriformis]|uniref:hypothetical protein n=1 Tax=Anatilimnocola floriformis TaxID=2948575 RepID=UPI0020C1C30C|nr:hypothetical protein [Anatilimnocola floriformis]